MINPSYTLQLVFLSVVSVTMFCVSVFSLFVHLCNMMSVYDPSLPTDPSRVVIDFSASLNVKCLLKHLLCVLMCNRDLNRGVCVGGGSCWCVTNMLRGTPNSQ